MTGYGFADGQLEGVTYAVEIKTVNSRYFKAKIKLPDTIAFIEADIEKLLQKNLVRGAADCVIGVRDASANVPFAVDEKILGSSIERLKRIAASAGVDCSVDIVGLLTLQGMLAPPPTDENKISRLREFVLDVTQQAVNKLKQMRCAEGTAIAAALDAHTAAIIQNLEQIRLRSAGAAKLYQEKLKKKIEELLADAKVALDEATLAREVAVFADKADISEEIARLDSHLQQFAQSCKTNEQAGRRLDFISQELLREANTIASKALDNDIIHRVVDIKCIIEQIKEQVQNVV
jgi:uncharacterized protein (TIGR00255 family)